MDFLPIDKLSIPYDFDVVLGNKLYTFEVNYNSRFDFFTVDLSDNTGNILVQGEKIMYGQPLFSSLDDPALPTIPLTPLDLSGQETRAGYDQLGATVLLIVGDTVG